MRKNFCKLLGMKVPLYFELWIEEACANIPVSSLHLQAHPVALCVKLSLTSPGLRGRNGPKLRYPGPSLAVWQSPGCGCLHTGWVSVLTPCPVTAPVGECHSRAALWDEGKVTNPTPQHHLVPLHGAAALESPPPCPPEKRGAPLTCHPRARSVSSRHAPWPGAGVRTSRLAQSSLKGY